MMCMIIGRPKPEIVYTDIAVDNTNATTHTYSGVALGAEKPGRLILVSVADGAVTTAVTVAGVSATLVDSFSGFRNISLWAAVVPTGATGTIVVTQASATFRIFIGVAAAYNLRSTTPIDTATDESNTINTLTVSVNTLANGIAFGATCLGSNVAGPNATWSGLTEDAQLNGPLNGLGDPLDCFSVASLNTTTAQTPRPITATWNLDPIFAKVAIAASFA